jgi:SAM-dependent methyltransferase
VLAALADAGLLEREGGRYRPTETCRAGLCDPESEEFVGGGLALWLHNLGALVRLDEVLRTGIPLDALTGRRDRHSVARLMSAMAAAPAARVRKLVDGSLRRARRPRRALDVGAGPGHMSRELADRGLHVTLFDTPETIDYVRTEYRLGEEDRLTLVSGDFTKGPLPDGPFDLVLLSNVLHIYGPEQNRRLVHEAARVTSPGGVVAIQDFVRGRSGRAARFALVMLLRTEGGDTYELAELTDWMESGGLEDVRVEDLDPDRQLVTAIRP